MHVRQASQRAAPLGAAADSLHPARVATGGVTVDMENYYSRLALDIIGKAVFNYDFDSLSKDDPVIRAVYTTLREAEHRSLTPIPYWRLPFADVLIPRQVRAAARMHACHACAA